MATHESTDVVVIGAGLAGLACAFELEMAGVDYVVLEGAGEVGGRVGSDLVDGFVLDRGFQVYLPAYPDAGRILDYDLLSLAPLYAGALVRVDERFHRVADPRKHPLVATHSLSGPVFRPGDAVPVVRIWREAVHGRIESPRTSTAQYLAASGLSDVAIEHFFRPFFGGVFLDSALAAPADFFLFLFAMFAQGGAALPAQGMSAIPEQLAFRLSTGRVRTGTPVTEIDGSVVRTRCGASFSAARIVVATDARQASRLVPGIEIPRWTSTTTLYFAADRSPMPGRMLILDGEQCGPVNHVCVPSDAAPAYAPSGAALVSASVIGSPDVSDQELIAQAKQQLRKWFGAEVEAWQTLKVYRIGHALPQAWNTVEHTLAARARRANNLYVCGDHVATPSINGAIASGVAAARSLLIDRAQYGSEADALPESPKAADAPVSTQ